MEIINIGKRHYFCIVSRDVLFIYTRFTALVSEIESDLRDTVDWGSKWLADFNAEKTQLLSLFLDVLRMSMSTELTDTFICRFSLNSFPVCF